MLIESATWLEIFWPIFTALFNGFSRDVIIQCAGAYLFTYNNKCEADQDV